MQSVLSRIWTRVGVSISYDDNHYTTGTSSVSHNRVQVLSIPVLLLACSQDWTCNLQMILFRSFENQRL